MPLEVQERYDFGVVWAGAVHRFPVVVDSTIFWFPRQSGLPALWFDTATVTGGQIGSPFPIPCGGAIVGPDGFIYVTPYDDNHVVRVNPATKSYTVLDILTLGGAPSGGRYGVASHNGVNRIVARYVGFRETSGDSGTSNVWLHIDTNTLDVRVFTPGPWTNSQHVSDSVYVPWNNTIYSVPKNQGSGYWIYRYEVNSTYNLATDVNGIIGVPGSGTRYGSQMWLGQDGVTIYYGWHSAPGTITPLGKINTVTNTSTILPHTLGLTTRVDEALYGHDGPWVHLGGGVHVGAPTNSSGNAILFDESTETFTTLASIGVHRPGGTLGGNGRAYWGRLGSTTVTEYDPGTGLFTAIPREAGSNMQYFTEPKTVGGNVYFLEENGVNTAKVAWIQTAPPEPVFGGIYMFDGLHLS